MNKKKCLTVAFIATRAFLVTLLISLIFSVIVTQVQASLTLTVASKPGGSIIVESSAINGGQAVTVAPSQEQTWTVPYMASVKLTATDFASGLSFKGWDGPLNGKPFNPTILSVDSNMRIAGYFYAADAPNVVAVTLQSPGNKTYNQKSVLVTFAVESPLSSWLITSVYGIRFYLDGTALNGTEWSSYESSSGNFYHLSSNLSEPVLEDGPHSLYVLAKATFHLPNSIFGDPAPGSGVSDMVYFAVDTTEPIVSVLSPEDSSYFVTDVQLSFNLTDQTISWMGYSIDGKEYVMINEDALVPSPFGQYLSTWSGNLTLTGLSQGSHYLTVCASDAAGHTGTSDTIHFTVASENQSSELFPVALVIVSVFSASIVGAGLVFYFRKRKH